MAEEWQTEPSGSKRTIVLVVLAGVVTLCVVIGVVALFFLLRPAAPSAAATSTEVAVANADATRATRPTLTPRPTRTTAPTFTPRPTRTPVPTEAPTPTIDPALVEYGFFFFDVVFNLEERFYSLAILNEQARQNPALLSDTQWLTDLTRVTSEIEQLAQRVLDYPFATVPSIFVGSHTKLTEAMVLYRDSMVLYRQGIGALDSTLIADSFTNFERANILIEESGNLLPTFE